MDFNGIPMPPGYLPPTHMPPGPGHMPPPGPGHMPPVSEHMPPVTGMGQHLPPRPGRHMPRGDMGGGGMMMQNPYAGQEMYQGGAHTDLEFTELNSVLVDGGDRFGVCALCFDNQELLWMGNQGGHVTSYYGIELQKYTSFQIHQSEDIRQIVPMERGILSLTQSSLNCSLRRGIPLFNYRGASMSNMQCMLMTSPSSVLIGGHQPKVIELDIEKLEEIREVFVPEPGCAILRHSNKYICAGDTNGKVTLYDPNSLRVEHVLDAHTGTLSDFDIHGNLLVTCGFSTRHNNLTVDRFLMVYDMRVMRAMAPIQVIIDPMFLRFVSTHSNKLAVVSQGGQFQLIETSAMTPASMLMYPINTQGGAIMSFDISSNCQALSFGDSSGYMHLFVAGENPVYNQYPISTEFSDPMEPIQPIHMTDELTPYSIIPMMYPTSGNLLSDWPPELCTKVYRKPKPIDPEILRSMKIQHDVGYAKNFGKEKRNQVPYKMQGEKSRKGKGVPESPIGRVDDPFVIVPKRYRKVDLKYSKLGLEDFDFRHYNKTPFAGLETDIPNAYCNGMLQVLYFIEPIRCNLLGHVCEKEFCLSCELGFLFHMFDQQKGQTCQASNFLRAFRTIPEAAALGLVLAENEETDPRINLSRLIQSWQRFLYQQVHSEMSNRMVIEDTKSEENLAEQLSSAMKLDPDSKQTEKAAESPQVKSKKKKKKKGKKKSKDHHDDDKSEKDRDDKDGDDDKDDKGGTQEETSSPDQSTCSEEKFEERSIISDLLGIKIVTTLKCRCGQETQRQSDTNLINLAYPECFPNGKAKAPLQFTFADVVHHSLTMEQNVQAWCNVCDRYQPHNQRKMIQSIPDVLGINCHIENIRDYEFWKVQHQILKQQKEDMVNDGTSFVAPQISMSNVVMCRYGDACRRNGCRFRHARDATEPQETNYDEDPDCQWIPLGLVLELHPDGTLNIRQVSDEVPVPRDLHPNIKYYEILATIFHIRDEKTAGNIVSCVHVGETFHQRKENVTCTQWYLFNDFSILPIEKLEAVQCNMDWKVPCTIYFKRRYINKFYDLQVKCPITSDVLKSDNGLVNPEKRIMTFTPIENEEIPKKGDVVALDAEFVSLNQEESELRSDGTRSMIKPSHLAVARITCVRGEGDKSGEPFIDDYISTQEQVVDYLTQWSGIQPGDLDPAMSTKHLTTLKSTYQKLRYLVDAGVVFLGHGLKKDFRVINITVPKAQIIDTVQLFYIPRQRMISLKFLAWYFLKMSIQSSAHDSVEDSRTALQLYRKYLEISKPGSDHVRAAIKEMYEYGRKNQWKIPDMEDMVDNPLDFLQTET